MLGAITTRKNVATQLIILLKERFVSFDQNVFSLMSWCNLQFWSDKKYYRIEEIPGFQSWANKANDYTCTPLHTPSI